MRGPDGLGQILREAKVSVHREAGWVTTLSCVRRAQKKQRGKGKKKSDLAGETVWGKERDAFLSASIPAFPSDESVMSAQERSQPCWVMGKKGPFARLR